jgi:peptidoglycan/LPS O-acetylase OafA/YrhL
MSRPDAAHQAYLSRRYFPELDGLRALCVLLVISVHMYDSAALWKWLAGSKGVTVFFILSGYLITTLGLREEEERGSVSLAAFYVRRCCRLLPLYYLVLGLYGVLLVGLGLGPGMAGLFKAALPYYAFYLQEVPFYSWLVLGQQDVPFFHSWSLGVEEKFYLLWPLLAFVAWRGDCRRRLAGALALAGLFALAPLLWTMGPVGRAWGRCLFCYFSLLAGCALAQLLHDPVWFGRLRRLGRLTWPALILFLGCHFATPWCEPGSATAALLDVVYTLGATAFLACVLLGDGPVTRALRATPLVFVGRLSYGVYLVHVLAMVAAYRLLPFAPGDPVRGVLSYLLTCVVAVGVAWLLAVTVERHGVALGRRWSRRLTEPTLQPAHT